MICRTQSAGHNLAATVMPSCSDTCDTEQFRQVGMMAASRRGLGPETACTAMPPGSLQLLGPLTLNRRTSPWRWAGPQARLRLDSGLPRNRGVRLEDADAAATARELGA